MREAVLETVEIRRLDHGNLLTHLVQQLANTCATLRIIFVVHAEIEQCELDLSQHLHGGLEIFRILHAPEQIIGNLLTALVVGGNKVQCLASPSTSFP